ncbi:MAG: ferredoxin--NADP reductase, partial [Planctomycetota bacterium]|nr:ferredoxin--NADP reductase [Planctomycetota bacterium]
IPRGSAPWRSPNRTMKIHGPNAEVIARIDWTDGLATFRVRPVGWDLPTFTPGQFANLALPAGEAWDTEQGEAVRRPYSVASTPGEEHVDVFVRRVDDGELTPSLFDLQPGDGIYLEERITGHFTLEGAQDAEDLILVGTGTGVAPYRPMILDPSTRERFGRVLLFYSDRNSEDLGYLEEFRALEAGGSHFRFFPTITRMRDDEEWSGLTGRVQQHLTPAAYEALTGAALDPARCQVFLCGNPQMVVEVRQALEELDFKRHRKREPGQLHMEKYW